MRVQRSRRLLGGAAAPRRGSAESALFSQVDTKKDNVTPRGFTGAESINLLPPTYVGMHYSTTCFFSLVPAAFSNNIGSTAARSSLDCWITSLNARLHVISSPKPEVPCSRLSHRAAWSSYWFTDSETETRVRVRALTTGMGSCSSLGWDSARRLVLLSQRAPSRNRPLM